MRAAPIPSPETETLPGVRATYPADTVFAPAVSARTRVVVRKKFPGCAAQAVILANRSPLPLGEVGPPALPMLLAGARIFEPAVFRGLDSWHGRMNLGKKVQPKDALSPDNNSPQSDPMPIPP